MDKETADYIFQKGEAFFQKVTPQLENLTSDYIEYVVFNANISVLFAIVFLIISLIILGFGIYQGQKREWEETGIVMAPTIIGGFATVIFFIVFSICLYDIIIANKYPTIYALERLVR